MLQRRTSVHLTPACLLLSLAIGGCSDGSAQPGSTPSPDGGTDLDALACERFAKGPFADVTAAHTLAAAPEVGAEDTAHRITLVPDPAGKSPDDNEGYVKLTAAEAAPRVIFANVAVPLTVRDAADAVVAVAEGASSCADVEMRLRVELQAGSYFLRFDPTTVYKLLLLHARE